MVSQGPSGISNTELTQIDRDQFALAFINRRPDQKTVATMAPIGTDIRYQPNNNHFNDNFKAFFESSYEPNFETSLEMGFNFTEENLDAKFAGSSTALKKLFMEPYRAGPLSLFCHRIGETIYVDMDNIVPDETFKEKVQHFNENQGYIPYTSVPYPGLTLYENLIWNCKEASDVWKEHYGIYGSTELSLDFSKSALTPMFESYSYKIQTQNSHNEAYIWEFHNTKMLVDSEVPIFGGGNYPAVTIRLSEGDGMPISVLTGVDMLLDQLMHHIKETIVVHHAEGKVKKYDVVVQKEIPYLKGSEFDSSKLQSITSNMYNFLNSNMTQQGHTYWLCREQHSDELRLYDLTAICPEQARNRHKNPFLMPVVNLMYKISCKLINETMDYRSQKVTNVAWGLLTAADKLLEHAHVPEFRACINYLLAGLYLDYDPDAKIKKGKKTNQDDLLKGLSEEMFKGYSKFPGLIKVEDLTENKETTRQQRTQGSQRYTIPNCKLRMDSATTALDYCREALTCLEKCRHDDEEIPFVADNPDDMAAYKELEHTTDDVVFNHLRHALLLRAATCYLILATQATMITSGVKNFRYSQAGLQCCSSVMSSFPSKRHEIIGKSLMPSLASCFAHSIHTFCDTVTDASYLSLQYREMEIIKIATEHVNFLEKFNFSRCWNFKSDPSINFAVWTTKLDLLVAKFIPLIQEDFSQKKKIQDYTLLDALSDRYDAASRIALVLTEIGGMIIKGLQMRINEKEEDEIAQMFQETPEMAITSAVHFYDKSIELIDLCPDTENFCRVRSILLINSVVAKKVSLVLARARKEPFLEQCKIAEEIFSVYHRAFSNMPKELKTMNGIDIHVQCLIEYSDVILSFVAENAESMDKHFPGRRKAYYEACLRLYDVIFQNHKKIPIVALSELTAYKTHVFYVLLKTCALDLNMDEVDSEEKGSAYTKKIRKSVKDYLEVFERCLKHVESFSQMNLMDGVRKPQSYFCRDVVPCFSSSHLSGAEKIKILKLTTRWIKAVLDCAPLTDDDDIQEAKQYAIKSTVEIRSIATGMMPYVDKASEKKLAAVSNALKLVRPPTDDKELIKAFADRIADAIKQM